MLIYRFGECHTQLLTFMTIMQKKILIYGKEVLQQPIDLS